MAEKLTSTRCNRGARTLIVESPIIQYKLTATPMKHCNQPTNLASMNLFAVFFAAIVVLSNGMPVVRGPDGKICESGTLIQSKCSNSFLDCPVECLVLRSPRTSNTRFASSTSSSSSSPRGSSAQSTATVGDGNNVISSNSVTEASPAATTTSQATGSAQNQATRRAAPVSASPPPPRPVCPWWRWWCYFDQ